MIHIPIGDGVYLLRAGAVKATEDGKVRGIITLHKDGVERECMEDTSHIEYPTIKELSERDDAVVITFNSEKAVEVFEKSMATIRKAMKKKKAVSQGSSA